MTNDETDLSNVKTNGPSAKLRNASGSTTTDVNKEMIEAALKKTPTGGNSKPFLWDWKNNTLEIRHDEKLAAHYLNRNDHTSWIALGCLLESVQIAAANQNWSTEVTIHGSANATIQFKKLMIEDKSNENYARLLKRTTYRGAFKPSEAPTVTADSNHQGEQVVQIKTLAAKDLTTAFKNLLVTADTYLWLQTKATKAFFKEVRFFEDNKEDRGIRSKDLGVGIMDQIMLFCFSFMPWMIKWVVKTPVLNLSFKKVSLQNIKNSHFVLVTSHGFDPQSLILVGRQSLKAWLNLEEQGFSVQPYSTASITLVDAATGFLPQDTLSVFKKLFSVNGPAIYQEQFKLFSSEKPVWLFRVGKK